MAPSSVPTAVEDSITFWDFAKGVQKRKAHANPLSRVLENAHTSTFQPICQFNSCDREFDEEVLPSQRRRLIPPEASHANEVSNYQGASLVRGDPSSYQDGGSSYHSSALRGVGFAASTSISSFDELGSPLEEVINLFLDL